MNLHKDREKLKPGWKLNSPPSDWITVAWPLEFQGRIGTWVLRMLFARHIIMNEKFVSKETVEPRRWESETTKFGIKEVDNSQMSTLRR